MVLAGICGETPWLARFFIPKKRGELRMMTDWRVSRLKKPSEFLLIIGIAGEILCLAFSLVDTAKLNKEAAGIGTTNAQLVADNLVLRSNVAVLEAAVQWRTIKHEQETNIISHLRPFLQTNFMHLNLVTIHLYATDPEAQAYAYRIEEILRKGGCKTGFEAEAASVNIEPIYGLEFEAQEPPSRLAVVVIEGFKAAGIIPDRAFRTRGLESDVKIWVGHKPGK